MANLKFELNLPGLNELMKSPEMQQILDAAALKIADAAGEGYAIEAAHPIRFVSIASVLPGDFETALDNSKNNTLLKAVGRVKI